MWRRALAVRSHLSFARLTLKRQSYQSRYSCMLAGDMLVNRQGWRLSQEHMLLDISIASR